MHRGRSDTAANANLNSEAPQNSEECRKPQPPLLLKKVSQYASHLYCNTRETFPNPERSQNRRFPEKSRIELRTGKFRPAQSHNLLLAKLILSPLGSERSQQYASNLYCSAFGATELSGKGNTSVLLPFVSQYASHLYCNTPPICIAMFLGKSWWLWSPGCSPKIGADFRLKGIWTATFQFSESGGSPNGPDLFTELPFL